MTRTFVNCSSGWLCVNGQYQYPAKSKCNSIEIASATRRTLRPRASTIAMAVLLAVIMLKSKHRLVLIAAVLIAGVASIPFIPREDRPVYCSDCFQSHRPARSGRRDDSRSYSSSSSYGNSGSNGGRGGRDRRDTRERRDRW